MLSRLNISQKIFMSIVFNLDVDKNKTKTKQQINRHTKYIVQCFPTD